MYLSLQELLGREASAGDLFAGSLASPESVSQLLPQGDPALELLQQVREAGPLFLDLCHADTRLQKQDIDKVVRAIRSHWHQHGFCIAQSADQDLWTEAADDYQQPLLHWPTLSIIHGWHLVGFELQWTDLNIFRLLVTHGAMTVEQAAGSPTVFSQRPNFNDPHVRMDIAMGRIPRGPSGRNRSEAQDVLQRMYNRRIVIERGGFYGIVRPTRENGV